MRALRVVVTGLFVLAPLVAAACGDDSPPAESLTNAGSDAGSSRNDGATVDGSPALDATTTDGVADGAVADGADATSYDPESICPSMLSVGTGALLPISTAGADLGLSVTPDELSAAWFTVDSGIVTIHYVDRRSKSAAFGGERTFSGAFASERVALAPNGLSLAVVDANGLGFSLLSRSERDDAFGSPDVGPFQMLDDQGQSTLAPAGERYGDPLFTRNGSYFFFSRFGGGRTTTVYVATRIFASDPFSSGIAFAPDELAATASGRRRVTGASVDTRTLFVWDETMQKSRAIHLDALSGVVGSSDLGTMNDVQTNDGCDAFYFSRGIPTDLFRAVP